MVLLFNHTSVYTSHYMLPMPWSPPDYQTEPEPEPLRWSLKLIIIGMFTLSTNEKKTLKVMEGQEGCHDITNDKDKVIKWELAPLPVLKFCQLS